MRIWRGSQAETASDAMSQRGAPIRVAGSDQASHRRWAGLDRASVFICIVGFAVAIIGLIGGYQAREESLDLASQSLEARAALLADQAQRAIETINLIETTIISRASRQKISTIEEFHSFAQSGELQDDLRSRLRGLQQLRGMQLIDAGGRPVELVGHNPNEPASYAQSPGFQYVTGRNTDQLMFSPPGPISKWNQDSVIAARRITNAEGQLVGLVTASLDLTYFSNLYRRSMPESGRDISLLREDGLVLVQYPQRADEPMGFNNPVVLAGLANGEDSMLTIGRAPLRGIERIIAAHRVGPYPLRVQVSLTLNSALSRWRHYAWWLGAAIGVVEVMVIGALLTLRRERRALAMAAQSRLSWGAAERARLVVAHELEQLIAALPATVVKMRQDPASGWRTVFVSDNVEQLTGYSAQEVRAPDWIATVLDPQDLALLRERQRAALVAGHGVVEITARHRNFSLRRLRARISASIGPDGGRDLVVIWTDVTAEREVEAQLAQSAKLATLGELAAGIAHELNQPLSSISLAAENAVRRLDRIDPAQSGVVEPVSRKLELITDMAHRAANIIDHMRVFGRTGDGDLVPVDLRQVVMDARLLLGSKLSNTKVALLIDLPEDLPAVLAKPVPLEQVVLNLVGNACDAYHTQPADPLQPQHVRISARADARIVRLTVSDQAGGIPEHVLPRIFEPFFTTKASGEGTGLGLSISYNIVAQMGGRISVRNVPGGAEFEVTLPIASA